MVPTVEGHVTKSWMGSWCQIERPGEKRCHVGAPDGIKRAEAGPVAATGRNAKLEHPFRVGRPPLPCVDVVEARLGRLGGIAAVHDTHNPHSHLPAENRLIRAKEVLPAGGTVKHPQLPKFRNRLRVVIPQRDIPIEIALSLSLRSGHKRNQEDHHHQ